MASNLSPKRIFSLAPIQGITDRLFRNLFLKHFSACDRVYSPYVRYDKDWPLQIKKLKELDPELNSNKLIPQIMVNQSDHLTEMVQFFLDLGYSHININLGCPYPMVTKRKLGAGLLADPEGVRSMFSQVKPELLQKVSVKLRLGLLDSQEIQSLIPVLNLYPFEEVIVHPRIAKDLYKARANRAEFLKINSLFNTAPAYNGDLFTVRDIDSIIADNPEVPHLMLGRGWVSNPFLVEDFLGFKHNGEKKERFFKFHDELADGVFSSLAGPGHGLIKMLGYWIYFSQSFDEPHKVKKWIKKAKNLDQYNDAIQKIKSANNWVY